MIDRNSDTWERVNEWAEVLREQARTELEAPGTDIVQTEILRARIAQLTTLIDLDKVNPTAPPKTAVPPGY